MKTSLLKLILILGLLFVILISLVILIDPEQFMRKHRNDQRKTDIENILSLVEFTDLDSISPGDIHVIGTCPDKGETGCTIQTTHQQCLDLSQIIDPVPKDPFSGTDYKTDYYIKKGKYGKITVGACDPEPDERFGNGTPELLEVSKK